MTAQEELAGTRDVEGTATLVRSQTVFKLGGGTVYTIGGFTKPDFENFGYEFGSAPAWFERDWELAGRSHVLVGVDVGVPDALQSAPSHPGNLFPQGVVFTNSSFGPAKQVGTELNIRASFGDLTTCTLVQFAGGADAVPTIVDSLHIKVIVPLDAIVGPVYLVTAEGRTLIEDTFYPYVVTDWHDRSARTETWGLLPRSADDTVLLGAFDRGYWNRAKLPFSADPGTGLLLWTGSRAFADSSLAAVMAYPDSDGGGGIGGPIAAEVDHVVGDSGDIWAVRACDVVFDLNKQYLGGYPLTSTSSPDIPNPPNPATTLVHSGDPWDWEDEGVISGVYDWSGWIDHYSFNGNLQVLDTGYDFGGTTPGSGHVQIRVIPVADLPYVDPVGHPEYSPVQGTWWTGAQLAGFPVVYERLVTPADVGSTIPISFDLDVSEVRFDQNNGTHAMIVICFKEAVEESETLALNEVVVAQLDDSSLSYTFHYTPPRYRYLVPQYGIDTPVPESKAVAKTYWPVWSQQPNPLGPFAGFLAPPPAPFWYPDRVLVDHTGIVWALAPWFDGPFEPHLPGFDPPGKANIGFRFDPRSGRYVGPIEMTNQVPEGYDLFPYSMEQDEHGRIVIHDGNLVSWYDINGNEIKHAQQFPSDLDSHDIDSQGWGMMAVGADLYYLRLAFWDASLARILRGETLGLTEWGGANLWSTTTDDIFNGTEVLDLLSWQRSQSLHGKPMAYWYPENHYATTRDGHLVVGFTGWFGRDGSGFPFVFSSAAVNDPRPGLLWIKNGAVVRTVWLTEYNARDQEYPMRGSAADPNIVSRGFGNDDVLVKVPSDPGNYHRDGEIDIWRYFASGKRQRIIKNFSGYYSPNDGGDTGAVFAYAPAGGAELGLSSGVVYEKPRGL